MTGTKRPEAGFTLAELLVTLTLAGIVGFGMLNLFVVQNQVFTRQNEGILVTQNARAGFDMMVREMRNAGFDPRGVADAAVTHWHADTFGWTTDLNGDGDVDDEDEEVAYFFRADPGLLIRLEGAVEEEIAEGITNLSFTYFSDEGATVATTVDGIEQVGIAMTYATPDGVSPGSLETQVALRNSIYK